MEAVIGMISHRDTVPYYDVCERRFWLAFGQNVVIEVSIDCLVQVASLQDINMLGKHKH